MHNQLCKNCGQQFTGKFCNNCGEKLYKDNDRSLPKLFHEAFHFLTHFEGTFLTSLKTIITAPGKISLDYCNGIRKKYFKPLSFFLLLIILYLLFPFFEGLNMKLHFYTQKDYYGANAAKKVAELMQARGISFAELEKIFQQKGEKISKFLLFIIIPFMAMFTWLLAFKKRKFYFDHFIFSTEMASFFILWGFLLFPFLIFITRWLTEVMIIRAEWQTGVVVVSAQIIFTAIASRRFFSFKRWYSILFASLYIIALFVFMKFIYKFILFNIAIRMV